MEGMGACSTTKVTRERLHATTNLESGHGERKKVSSHLVCSIDSLRNKANRFCVPLRFLSRYSAMSVLRTPRLLSEEGHADGLVLVGSLVGERGDDERERMKKKVSQKLTRIHFTGPGHEC
jgi:hypothetical protein